jgi:hypothetical protein
MWWLGVFFSRMDEFERRLAFGEQGKNCELCFCKTAEVLADFLVMITVWFRIAE